ncbi:nucleotidyltransferase family protein [Aestuariivirga litoralis]|uniref:nucleotidyltransferase family protein n=1 Tax=Aestuariivirga litoralis TaxID=2650924 RepID=UPI0018C75804|nr:nucleotidyltransferase family protein [Aestuariivirga litoralis]MBG1231275.1 nucleotidyltransferase family protein [Aestuariivirga litoralis]
MSNYRIAAVVLAAGQSSRMGFNKLLAELNGKPLIVRVVEQVAASGVVRIIVVTGHQADEIKAALKDAEVQFVHNYDYAQGLSTSLRAGLLVAKAFDGAIVCLGDMPLIEAGLIKRMIAAFEAKQGRSIVAPVVNGELGNPVLWGRNRLAELMSLRGDKGARGILEAERAEVVEIPVVGESVLLDADTPDALAKIRQTLS